MEASQDSGSLGRDLRPGPPEYEAGLLTARRRPMEVICFVQDLLGKFFIRIGAQS